MEYTFDVIGKNDRRLETTTKYSELKPEKIFPENHILATNNITGAVAYIGSLEDWEEWLDSRIKALQWSDKTYPQKVEGVWNPVEELTELTKSHEHKEIAKTVNPSHYQGFFGGHDLKELQWLEAKQYEGKYRNPELFKAAVGLQIEKYLDRNGKKDAELQEMLKGLWYMKFLVAYIKNGNKPIRVEAIDKILSET
jgi:hypothetical protein